MNGRNFFTIVLVLMMVFFLCMDNAHAYIDPGTGSMILQALMAGALVVLAFGKRIYGYLYGVFHKGGADDDAAELKADSEDEA